MSGLKQIGLRGYAPNPRQCDAGTTQARQQGPIFHTLAHTCGQPPHLQVVFDEVVQSDDALLDADAAVDDPHSFL